MVLGGHCLFCLIYKIFSSKTSCLDHLSINFFLFNFGHDFFLSKINNANIKCIYATERGYHPSRSVESIHIHYVYYTQFRKV